MKTQQAREKRPERSRGAPFRMTQHPQDPVPTPPKMCTTMPAGGRSSAREGAPARLLWTPAPGPPCPAPQMSSPGEEASECGLKTPGEGPGQGSVRLGTSIRASGCDEDETVISATSRPEVGGVGLPGDHRGPKTVLSLPVGAPCMTDSPCLKARKNTGPPPVTLSPVSENELVWCRRLPDCVSPEFLCRSLI